MTMIMMRSILILFCVFPFWVSSVKPLKDLEPFIINGDQATLGQFPWQVALTISGPISSRFCSGSIISRSWVLTAGHCLVNGIYAVVVAGVVNISHIDNYATTGYPLIIHDNYDPNTNSADIGLIHLDTPLIYDDNIKAIAVASEELQASVDVTVSGWGKTHDDDWFSSDLLNYVTITTITNDQCQKSYNNSVLLDMVCATSLDDTVKSPCLDDSGGPVVTDAFTNPVLVAVISFTREEGCESGVPSAYTRTAYYRDWIRNIITGI